MRQSTIRKTDIDALSSRLSANIAGYLHDPYVSMFASAQNLPQVKKLPLINRGTYIRTVAIDDLIKSFLSYSKSTNTLVQIVSLGAGSDTRAFSLLKSHPNGLLIYHEIDFPKSVQEKTRVIVSNTDVRSIIHYDEKLFPETDSFTAVDIPLDNANIYTDVYNLHALDLATVIPHETQLKNFNRNVPTIFFSECCLCYLLPEKAENIVDWCFSLLNNRGSLSKSIPVGFILYEPIRGDNARDPFADVMLENLALRGISLQTVAKYSSLSLQVNRLYDALLKSNYNCNCDSKLNNNIYSAAVDICHTESKWLDTNDIERIDHLEILDEREEWDLLAKHYSIVYAYRDDGDSKDVGPFAKWKGFSAQKAKASNR